MTESVEGTSALEAEPLPLRTKGPAQVAIPTNPAEMLYLAMAQGQSMDVLKQFMDLKDRWDASEAKKAFVAAMAGFKAENVVVGKDRANVQYGSRYTSLGNLINVVVPFLSKHGLSHDWVIDQESKNGIVRVGCTLTHEMGHSETRWFECPPDKSGAKNPIQEIKSAITYAKAVTFESVCGLAATDANLDDDGNHAGQRQGADPTFDLEAEVEKINGAKDEKELTVLVNAALARAQKSKDRNAGQALMQAQKDRRAALRGGTK